MRIVRVVASLCLPGSSLVYSVGPEYGRPCTVPMVIAHGTSPLSVPSAVEGAVSVFFQPPDVHG